MDATPKWLFFNGCSCRKKTCMNPMGTRNSLKRSQRVVGAPEHRLEKRPKRKRESIPTCHPFFLCKLAVKVSGRAGYIPSRNQKFINTEFIQGFKRFMCQENTTPPKINIEPENDGFENAFPFPGVYSQVLSCGVYQVLNPQKDIKTGSWILISWLMTKSPCEWVGNLIPYSKQLGALGHCSSIKCARIDQLLTLGINSSHLLIRNPY